MLQERCRPLAQSGVIEAPRVQLENGLLRTKQKPTSLPTLHDNTRSRGAAKKFHTRRVGTTGEQLEKSLHAAEQLRPDVAEARHAFIRRQPALGPARLLFLDETSATTNRTRRSGRCALRLLAPVPHGHRKTTTLVAGLRTTGITTPYVLDGAVNGDIFRAYVEQILAPTLGPGDIVVMDNLPCHKVAGIQEAIESRQARLLYLPPYSPDLNPIEQAFAKLKALLRKVGERTRDGLWKAIGHILKLYSPDECRNLFRNSGYST